MVEHAPMRVPALDRGVSSMRSSAIDSYCLLLLMCRSPNSKVMETAACAILRRLIMISKLLWIVKEDRS
jgi:hypothetical protein